MDADSDSDLSSLLTSAPSSPLSELSRSPSPPSDAEHMARLNLHHHPQRDNPYPSPPASQQTSHSGSPVPDGMAPRASTDQDGPPPPKRRRISKERTTEHLDLRTDSIDPDQQAQLDRLLHVLHNHQKIVVIAGAGISVTAGIPDFRSSAGLFRTLKDDHKLKCSGKDLFDASVYKDDALTSSFHDMVSNMSRMTKDAKPTAFHHMLATIAQEDRLLRLYSQNVDGIDTSLQPLNTAIPLRKDEAGKWPRTVQLHGGLSKMVCTKCAEVFDLDPSRFDGPVPPPCENCEQLDEVRTVQAGKRSHGIGRLRPRMVLYNEHNPDDEAIGAVTKDDLRRRPDAVIVVGTTLKVPGVRRIVREMCGVVRHRRSGTAIWINNDPPPLSKELDDCWDIIVQGPSDAVADQAAMRHWDDEDECPEITDEAARTTAEKALHVQVPKQTSPWPECHIPYADAVPLPSSQHMNNSFRPPSPNKLAPTVQDRGPSDWSPMSSRRSSISKVVAGNVDDSDTIGVGYLPTPSKPQASRRSSPSKKPLTSLSDRLKDTKAKPKAQQSTKGAKKAAATKTKKSNVKYIKPFQSQAAQAKTKALAKPKKLRAKSTPRATSTALTKAFKQSKVGSPVGKSAKGVAPSPPHSPSKPRPVPAPSAVGEPMHAISPQDPRNNAAPSESEAAPAPEFALKHEENAVRRGKRGRMSIGAVMN